MKKWVIVLLIVVGICFSGCSGDGEMSSLSEYEMVKGYEWQFQPVSNHKEFNRINGQIKIHKF